MVTSIDEHTATLHMNEPDLETLIDTLNKIRKEMFRLEKNVAEQVDQLPEIHRESARNLAHYIALRRHDIRGLQVQLAAMGLSSLGRLESSVMNSINTVLKVLCRLAGTNGQREGDAKPYLTFDDGEALLHAHTKALLGPPPSNRRVHIMVTMPQEAAESYALVRALVANGMSCMRINCAHDTQQDWARMIENLKRAEKELGKSCKVLMDVGGPKLRTGPVLPGPKVIKWRPERDAHGQIIAPVRIWLYPDGAMVPPPTPADAALPVSPDWLQQLTVGDRVKFEDTRGSSRSLNIVDVHGDCRWAESKRTAYVATGTKFVIDTKRSAKGRKFSVKETNVGELPGIEQAIPLKLGEVLLLNRDPVPGKPAVYDSYGRLLSPASIGCTLPEVFPYLRPSQAIWFDDGKVGGVIRSVSDKQAQVEITHARPTGEKLRGDKGINLPDTDLNLAPLTDKDIEDLPFIVANADLVGFSFVQHAEDVFELQSRLKALGGGHLGIVLKIETQRAFEQLLNLLLAALRFPAAGVMIARGDLAVECGYVRLAEVQEEILWLCQAAHVPVIWATDVLEQMAKVGLPSRAEITDAAMGERAECVMLNKGPHIVETLRMLDDILSRMGSHQVKKRTMFRKLNLVNRFGLMHRTDREIEAKFQVTSPEVFQEIQASKQIAGYTLTDQEVIPQLDSYLDTATGFLFHQGALLRLRRKPEGVFVTFKRQIEGNYVRTEIETPISEVQAQELLKGQLASIDGDALRAAIGHLEGKELQPVLHVENNREVWHMRGELGEVKLCFDTIQYHNADKTKRAYDYELELELTGGYETLLQEITRTLSEQHELIPQPRSKYQRAAAALGVFQT